jgi:arsenite methyltransferase
VHTNLAQLAVRQLPFFRSDRSPIGDGTVIWARAWETAPVSQIEFDDETGRALEALYRIGDAKRRREFVRAALGAASGERILDLGCGPGFYCAELVEEVGLEGSIVGVDNSPQMLALAGRRCEGHSNIEFRMGEATAVPVEDTSVDAAICVQVLEYVPDTSAGLAELYRTLRPGGRVVLWDVDWATVSWHSSDRARMARVLAAWDEHLAHPSLPRTLAVAMRSVGFEMVTMRAHSFATASAQPDAYGVAIIPVITNFVSGRNAMSRDEIQEWADEQRELGERGEFFFTCTQFCFTGNRLGA